MFGSPVLESLVGKAIEVCPPVAYLDNDYCTGHPDCVESDCTDDVRDLTLTCEQNVLMLCCCSG